MVKGWAGISESYVTQVPVLTLDRMLGNTLEGKRALILDDVEGAEFEVLRGAQNTLQHQSRPVWMMKIGSTIHQPEGVALNPSLEATFDMFFERGYTARSADAQQNKVDAKKVKAVLQGISEFGIHNFVFR